MEKKNNESFEDSLLKLETIVKELENGNVDLDKAIDKFNEAMNLARICDKKLKEAEKTITKMIDNDGKEKEFIIEE